MQFPGITRRAAAASAALTETLEKEEPGKGWVPVVSWVSDLDNRAFVPGPCIGADYRAKIPPEFLVHAHGLDFVFYLKDEKLAELKNSSLDSLEGRFLFVDKSAVQFLGG